MAASTGNARRTGVLQHGRIVPYARRKSHAIRRSEVGVAQRPLHIERTQVSHSATSGRRSHFPARTKYVRNTAAAASWTREVVAFKRRLQSQRLPNTSATTSRWSYGECLAFGFWRWTQPRRLLHTATSGTVPRRHGVLADERHRGLRRSVVLVPSASTAHHVVIAGARWLWQRRTIPTRTAHAAPSSTSAFFAAGPCATATTTAASSSRWGRRPGWTTAAPSTATTPTTVGWWTHLEAKAGG